jgi:AcrR family transcriptional regulator
LRCAKIVGMSAEAAPPIEFGRSKRADARLNQQRVIAAAREVFAERGLQASMVEIAERAGVGKATVYRSYPTKDDLVTAVAINGFQQLEHRGQDALASGDPYTALVEYVRDLFDMVAEDRLLAEALADATVVDPGRIAKLLNELLQASKPSGSIRADLCETDVRVLLCGSVLQLVRLNEHDHAVWRRCADLVLHAFRP